MSDLNPPDLEDTMLVLAAGHRVAALEAEVQETMEMLQRSERQRDALLTALDTELRPALDSHRQITKLDRLIAEHSPASEQRGDPQ